MRSTLSVSLLTVAASLPVNFLLIAQTSTTHKPVARRPATASTATRRASTSVGTCPVPMPTLAATIPALAATAPKCPAILYALTYLDTQIGTGELAQAQKWYTVHYTGYLTDGTKFDSSFDHPGKEPITFPYGAHRVIVGWDTGFENMHVGGKRRLFVPYQLAYGEMGRPPQIPAKSVLVFDVELVKQSATPPAPPPPPAPPAGTTPPARTPPPDGTTPPAGTTPPPDGSATTSNPAAPASAPTSATPGAQAPTGTTTPPPR